MKEGWVYNRNRVSKAAVEVCMIKLISKKVLQFMYCHFNPATQLEVLFFFILSCIMNAKEYIIVYVYSVILPAI